MQVWLLDESLSTRAWLGVRLCWPGCAAFRSVGQVVVKPELKCMALLIESNDSQYKGRGIMALSNMVQPLLGLDSAGCHHSCRVGGSFMAAIIWAVIPGLCYLGAISVDIRYWGA